jgi:hypothetical protein
MPTFYISSRPFLVGSNNDERLPKDWPLKEKQSWRRDFASKSSRERDLPLSSLFEGLNHYYCDVRRLDVNNVSMLGSDIDEESSKFAYSLHLKCKECWTYRWLKNEELVLELCITILIWVHKCGKWTVNTHRFVLTAFSKRIFANFHAMEGCFFLELIYLLWIYLVFEKSS